MEGWLKLHRELLDKPIWILSTPEQKTILITLLLMANHDQNKWEFKGQQYACKPGQFITSLESIIDKAGKGVSIRNTRTALKRFEKMGFLTNESTKQNRLITICNWVNYQAKKDDTDKQTDSQVTNDRQTGDKRVTTNKNDKKENNDKRKERLFIPPLIDEVKKYFLENGYNNAEVFFNYYSTGNWIDSKGNPVKNWKQKAISTWFKPENKITSINGHSIDNYTLQPLVR